MLASAVSVLPARMAFYCLISELPERGGSEADPIS